jgi:hypothetical protein
MLDAMVLDSIPGPEHLALANSLTFSVAVSSDIVCYEGGPSTYAFRLSDGPSGHSSSGEQRGDCIPPASSHPLGSYDPPRSSVKPDSAYRC